MFKYETSKSSKHLLYMSIDLNAGKVEHMVQQNQYHICAYYYCFSSTSYIRLVMKLMQLTETCNLVDFKCCWKQGSSFPCVIELLKYNNGRVLLDIQGHHPTETKFGHITREHPNVLERVFEDVDDCVHMLPNSLGNHIRIQSQAKAYLKNLLNAELHANNLVYRYTCVYIHFFQIG